MGGRGSSSASAGRSPGVMTDRAISSELSRLKAAVSARAGRMDGMEMDARDAERAGRGGEGDRIMARWRRELDKNKADQSRIRDLQSEADRRYRAAHPVPKKTFVNSFGEATTREITTQSYKNAMRRNDRDVKSFMGSRRWR